MIYALERQVTSLLPPCELQPIMRMALPTGSDRAKVFSMPKQAEPSPAARPRWRLMPTLGALVAGSVLALLVMVLVVTLHLRNVTIFNPNGWMTARDIGSVDTDTLTRAFIAHIGLFANSQSEAIYLQAYAGSPFAPANVFAGQPVRRLEGGTHYRIRGSDIPSAWWSITLYGADDYLFANTENRYAWRSDELTREPDGSFVIDVAPQRPAGSDHWLPSPDRGQVSLTLRIYRPKAAVAANLDTYALPRIERVEAP